MKENYITTGRVKQKLETRDKILSSAGKMLNERTELTLEEVAKNAGVSRATIYRYFSDPEVLAREAALDIKTKKPNELYQELRHKSTDEMILATQNYFNELTLDHEMTFRNYLSAVITKSSAETKRGARRKKTLDLILKDTALTPKEKKDLANLVTLLMGVEPIIITKDVCGLNNQQSLDLMQWGIKLILKNIGLGKAPPVKK